MGQRETWPGATVPEGLSLELLQMSHAQIVRTRPEAPESLPAAPRVSATAPGVSAVGLALWVQLGFPGPPRAPPVIPEAQAQGRHHVLPWPGAAFRSPAPDTQDPRCGATGSTWIPLRRGAGRGRRGAQGRD